MELGSGPIADALNTRPKYVASNTLIEPRWADTTVLSGDLAAGIGRLKAKQGGELQVHGSGALVRWLLENDLVDEMNLLIVPVVVGQGTRLFPDTGPDIALNLVDSRAFPKGVTLQVYRPEGARSMQPAEDTRHGCRTRRRPVSARWPRPAHVGNEKDLGRFRVIEASGPGTTLRNCRRRLRPARVSTDGSGEPDRSPSGE